MDTAFKIKTALVASAAYWILLAGIEYLSWTTGGVTHMSREVVAGAVVVWLLGLIGLFSELFHAARQDVAEEAWRRARLTDRFEPNAYIRIEAPTAALATATGIARVLVETSLGSYPKDGDCRLIAMADPTIVIKSPLLPKGIPASPMVAAEKVSVRDDGIVGFPCIMGKASTFQGIDGRKTLIIDLTLAEPEDYRTLCRYAVPEYNTALWRNEHVARTCRPIYPLLIPT